MTETERAGMADDIVFKANKVEREADEQQQTSRPRILSDEEDTMLLKSCRSIDEAAVSQCIAASRNWTAEYINARDNTGKTALCLVCAQGASNLATLLLSIGKIDPNISDNDGPFPTGRLTASNSFGLLETFLGNTPLIHAAQAGHSEIVSILIHGFLQLKVEQTNNQGFTALMKAAIQGRIRCAKLLLMAGASPATRDSGRGLCALEWAEYVGRRQCAKTIAQFMLSSTVDSLVLPQLNIGEMDVMDSRSGKRRTSVGLNLLSVAEHCVRNETGRRSLRLVSNSASSSSTDSVRRMSVFAIAAKKHQPTTTAATVATEPQSATSTSTTAKSSSPHHSRKKRCNSPLMNELQGVVRLSTAPVLPHYSKQVGAVVERRQRSRSTSDFPAGGGSDEQRGCADSMTIPKLEITMSSKDDNCFFERTFPISNSAEAPSLQRNRERRRKGSKHGRHSRRSADDHHRH